MTTPGQTVGPFFGTALPFPGDAQLVPHGHPGAVQLTGRVLDGAGEPVPDALIEIRQCGTDGAVPVEAGSLHRDGWTFTGWGRAATDRTGTYRFTTLRPGGAAPFFAVTLFARGLLDRLLTRAYLPGVDLATALPDLAPARRTTLQARDIPGGFGFDIHLQGEHETVFVERRRP